MHALIARSRGSSDDFATCPLPVKANQLQVRIPAGELRFHLR
jgi:uncharacterized protein (DUF1684 family)